jgi:hypothetical protein
MTPERSAGKDTAGRRFRLTLASVMFVQLVTLLLLWLLQSTYTP